MITNQELKNLRIGDWIEYTDEDDKPFFAKYRTRERGQYFFDVWSDGSHMKNFMWINIDEILDKVNLITEETAKRRIIRSKLKEMNEA